MTRLILSIALLLSFGSLSAQAPVNFQWAAASGSADFNDEALDIATDAQGNRYVTGYFATDFTFDASVNSLVSDQNVRSAFVAKFDTAGTLLWQKSLGNNNESTLSGGATGRGIAATPAGDVVVVGVVDGNVAEEGGDTPVLDTDRAQMFLWRLDTDGNTVWLKATGSDIQIRGDKVDFGANNDLYVAGTEIDPTPGDINLDFDDPTNPDAVKVTVDFDDVFVVRYNSSGGFLKAQTVRGNRAEGATDLDYTAADGGKVAVSGFTSSDGDVFVDDDTNDKLVFASPSNNNNAFFVVYNDTLAFDYGIPAVAENNNVIGNGVHFDDNNGELWALGTTLGLTNLGGTTGPSNGSFEDPFLLRINTSGGIDVLNQYIGNGGDRALGLDVDADGNAYVTGWVGDTLDMGDGFEYISAGGRDVFMMVVDTSGTTTYGTGYGSAAGDHGYQISIDQFGHVAVSGMHGQSFDLGGFTVPHIGDRDAHVAFFRNPEAIDVLRADLLEGELTLFPNPASDQLTLRSSVALNNASVTLTDLTGRTVASWNTLSLRENQAQQLQLEGINSGLYLLNINSTTGSISQRVIVR